jgi:hypothetical protein
MVIPIWIIGQQLALNKWRQVCSRSLAILLVASTCGCGDREPKVVIEGNVVNSSDSSLIPSTELASKVEEFRQGQLNLATPLMITYRDLGDEVSAAIYARSLSIQEGDPDAVAVQFRSLTRLKASPSVCEAMKESLKTWSVWKDDTTYNYQEAVAQFKKMCDPAP